MILTVGINQKMELVRKSDASQSDYRPIPSYYKYTVKSSDESTERSKLFSSSIPFSYQDRPAYEWVIPSCATFSSVDMIQALLVASEAARETSREKAEAAVNCVLVSVYELDEAGYGRSAAQEVMLFIENNLRQNRLVEANRILELADTSKLSSRSLIGLIRSTARLKDKLPAWEKAYLNSRVQVLKLGKNPDALFVGLPKLTDTNATKAPR